MRDREREREKVTMQMQIVEVRGGRSGPKLCQRLRSELSEPEMDADVEGHVFIVWRHLMIRMARTTAMFRTCYTRPTAIAWHGPPKIMDYESRVRLAAAVSAR